MNIFLFILVFSALFADTLDHVAMCLQALEALDRHAFHRQDSPDIDKFDIDLLYSNVFKSAPRDLSAETWRNDVEALIFFLCRWSTSTRRTGIHRGMLVACLLERFQGELSKPASTGAVLEATATAAAAASSSSPSYVLQDLLMKYLDEEGPKFEGNGKPLELAVLESTVLLFSELIVRKGETVEWKFVEKLSLKWLGGFLWFLWWDHQVDFDKKNRSCLIFIMLILTNHWSFDWLIVFFCLFEVFSHDIYVCSLIATGLIPQLPVNQHRGPHPPFGMMRPAESPLLSQHSDSSLLYTMQPSPAGSVASTSGGGGSVGGGPMSNSNAYDLMQAPLAPPPSVSFGGGGIFAEAGGDQYLRKNAIPQSPGSAAYGMMYDRKPPPAYQLPFHPIPPFPRPPSHPLPQQQHHFYGNSFRRYLVNLFSSTSSFTFYNISVSVCKCISVSVY